MPIPDYQSCMLPLLRYLNDGAEHALRETEEALADHLHLTPAERAELLPSGQQGIFKNRIGWARTYLKKAGLLGSPRRDVFRSTDRGRQALASSGSRIWGARHWHPSQRASTQSIWSSSPSSLNSATHRSQKSTPVGLTQPLAPKTTPEEAIELAHQELREQLAQELLSRILSCSPSFFEQLVVELLVKMGYGGSRKDAGQRIGQTGDGGIDGIIKEDRLGLDTIFIQAKRWQGSVGRPEIQKFVGALQGQRARKGVFITTSAYTAEAVDYASRIDTKVVLIDGKQLASLMTDFDVGASVSASYVVKRVDSDYFEEG